MSAPSPRYNLPGVTRRWRRIGVLGLLLSLSSCYMVTKPPVETRAPALPVERGIASWYGPGFHGKLTSSGEVFDQNKMTAAHRSLPLGSRVLVTNERNGRRVEVVINDRGPFVPGRIVDLSKRAAMKLDMLEEGTAPVTLRVLALPRDAACHVRYAVQVAAFTEPRRARRLIAALATRFDGTYLSRLSAGGKTYFRVRIGPFSNRATAEAVVGRLAGLGWPGVVVEEESK